MPLLLRVVSAQARSLGDRYNHVFGPGGGRIGRRLDNDWVLPDPELYVSNLHASVACRDGRWILTDHSSNGIYINGGAVPLPSRSSYALADYDRLAIGPYEILVRVLPEPINGSPRPGEQHRAQPTVGSQTGC
jgi:type VI secretion system protein